MSNYNVYVGKQFNFFKSLSSNELALIEKTTSFLKIVKGDIVFLENELLQKLYCIKEGACKFSLIDDSGKEHITKLLGKGDLMGRRSIITNKGALVTATAIKDTTLCLLDKTPIIKSLRENNAFCQDILKGFIGDMEDETEKIAYFQNHATVKVRLAGLLMYLNDKFGTEKEGWINVSLKRRDIAGILGTTSEYIISLLASFKGKNLLSLKRDKIKIISEKELRKFIKTC
ncbi:Crp/Fnr family transcriptional regulator [uncultured Algibacter sp.]|uniref:Crp/Fnr family transcriptional regulator n=1 Tax=uncultured Algibacter sp. TaxID=298659 RepID=UPI002634378C|nr:Crp/Fnr family transcriptional regulator [uncultured Algibacter sp.]